MFKLTSTDYKIQCIYEIINLQLVVCVTFQSQKHITCVVFYQNMYCPHTSILCTVRNTLNGYVY